MRPGALPRDRIFGPLQGLRQLQAGDGIALARGAADGSGVAPFNKLSGFAETSPYHSGGNEAPVSIRQPTRGNTHNTKA